MIAKKAWDTYPQETFAAITAPIAAPDLSVFFWAKRKFLPRARPPFGLPS
jgi:hypothetical protein